MGKAFKCDLCIEEFTCLDNLNVHIDRKHDEVRDREKKSFKCNVCSYEFSMGQYLIDHMRTHTGERPFKCTVDDCGMAFKQKSHLIGHVKSKHSSERPFKCHFPGCLHTTKTSTDLSKHKKVHSLERPFACHNDGCSFRAKSKSNVTRHEKSAHSEAKAFGCSTCDYKTTLLSSLKRHMRRHSSRRDFKCSHPQCTKSCKSSSDLKLHFSNQHGERNMQCDHHGCKRHFANVKALYDHKRFVHSNKCHVCPNPDCKFSTNSRSYLARHVIIHDRGNENISCSVEGCEYKGKTRRSLAQHMRRHKTLLPWPGSSCGAYTRTEDALQFHLKLHNSLGRPFQCPLCFKYFTALDQLQNHCVVHTNEKPFECGHCEFAAATQTRVEHHISFVHTSIAFPFIVSLLHDRVCLRCKVTLPTAEFLGHSKGHEGLVVMTK